MPVEIVVRTNDGIEGEKTSDGNMHRNFTRSTSLCPLAERVVSIVQVRDHLRVGRDAIGFADTSLCERIAR